MENIKEILPFAVNFTIVVVLLVVLLRKPLRRFVYQRHERWKDFLEDSAKVYEKSKARHKIAERGLLGVDADAKKLLDTEMGSAHQEAAELLLKADEEARRVRTEAERIVVAQGQDIGDRIKTEFVDLVVQQAEQQLRQGLKRDDHSAIFKRAQNSIEVGA